jgi:hypothetical protein
MQEIDRGIFSSHRWDKYPYKRFENENLSPLLPSAKKAQYSSLDMWGTASTYIWEQSTSSYQTTNLTLLSS